MAELLTTVEELLAEIDRRAPGLTEFRLWVPEKLSLQGALVPPDVAMVVIVGRLVSLDLFPDGFVEGRGGRTYIYRRGA